METITIKTFSDSFLANYALAKLNEDGIPAFLENDQDVLINPGIFINSNIKLKIMDYDYEKAVISLEDMDTE